MIDTIALPIEQQVNGVDHMLYMESTSAADGTYNLTVTFAIGTDPDTDQVLVQNRVQIALASMPEPVQAQGVSVQKKNTAILQIVTLNSPDGRYDGLYLSNYATINMVNELARLPGVGSVKVFGAGEYSMRIWMDPGKLYTYGLVPKDVIEAIRQQSQNVAAGQVGMPPAAADQDFQYTVDIQSRLNEPEQFGEIVVRDQTSQGGRLLRVKDVARIELGAQTYAQYFRVNGKPSAGIAIYQTPEANSLQVGKEVAEKVAALSHRFPQGLTYAIPYDTTIFVSDSINEVYKTLYQAGHPGADRNPGVPAEFPRRPGAGDDGAGHYHRRIRRHGGAGFHREPVHLVRHRAGDRHRGGRRDRHRGGRHQVHRERDVRPRFRHQGDGGTVRPNHRQSPWC